MIPYNEIRKALVSGLSDHTGLQVINMNGGGGIPKGAFITYHFEPGFNSTGGRPIEQQNGEYLEQMETVEFTVSFLSYADDNPVSMTNALQAQEWFKADGRIRLKDDLGIVVHNVGQVENRDVAIGTEWERRHGFEVEFRMQNISQRKLDVIEKVNIEGAGTIVIN
ncbi:hypothetical protein E6C60_2580 [Paenibacillus algicola]|uniref:Phage neck terminator protein gp12-like domain-containing protein n=1 Tax=Paenibacillus algicola TaxID=2565926 RepID=A0A4P8XKP1_9BACL|nr:hypothetical protein [Paenibacillus algicola]QCT03292.1 hypothetical protein E6C60_2580 [Paenibacillus algicola]